MSAPNPPSAPQASAATVITWARRPGVVLAALLAAYLLVNVVQALLDPAGFAARFGLPAQGSDAEAWVRVYAGRTFVLAVLLATLLALGALRALSRVLVLAGLVLPLGDAWLTWLADASDAIVVRHLVVVVVVLVAAALVNRDARAT